MNLQIIQPSSAQEAVDLLSSSPVGFDSPTNHRLRTRQHLEPAFASGRRRPDLVWAAVDTSGNVTATAAALRMGDGFVLDHWGARDHDGLAAVARAATAAAATAPEAEVGLFVPADASLGTPEVERWVTTLTSLGWRPLVERCHYEFEPARGVASAVATSLRLEPLTGPDDDRLLTLHREVLTGSLDAHDRDLVGRRGLEAALHESLAFLLGQDPWQCIRLAHEAGPAPQPVGLVSWRSMPGGRGFLLFVGVAERARGNGYGAQLVAMATRGLLAEGATTLIADTDVPNVPMVKAFERVGWPRTETRIDLVLG